MVNNQEMEQDHERTVNRRSSHNNGNKLLFWLVSRPRRMRISCCFVFSGSSSGGDSELNQHNNDQSSPPHQKSRNKRNNVKQIRIEDIGLPFDFRHTTHLGPESVIELTAINGQMSQNHHQISAIVCG